MLSQWVGHAAVSEELVVHEFQQRDVELSESSHDFVIDIEREPLVELVWCHPGDLLPEDFNAVVDAFDRVERF